MNKFSIILITILLAALSSAAWAGKDLPIVNGTHWVDSSLEQKRAYLFGIGNLLDIEQAMVGDKIKATEGSSIIPVLLNGLSGTSIADIVKQLDKFYTNHPEKIKQPVIEVLYIEMALPNLKK